MPVLHREQDGKSARWLRCRFDTTQWPGPAWVSLEGFLSGQRRTCEVVSGAIDEDPRRPAHLRRRARSRVGEKLPLSRERRRNSRRPFGYAPYRNNPNYRRHSRFRHGTIGSISRLMKCRARRGAKNSTREKRHETSSGSAWSLRFAALAGWNGRGATVQDGNRQCSQAFGVARRRSRADHGYGPADHTGRGPAVASRRGRRPAAASANGENGPSHTRRSGFTAGCAEPDPRRANGDTKGGRRPALGSRKTCIGPNRTSRARVFDGNGQEAECMRAIAEAKQLAQ